MTTRRTRGTPRALALLVLFALCTVAPAARAEDATGSSDADEGWKKVIAYSRCAFGVFIASTPSGIAAAFVDCTRLFLSEPPIGEGGAG